MNLETKITIYKFTPQLFTLTPKHIQYRIDDKQTYTKQSAHRMINFFFQLLFPSLPYIL